MLQNLARDLGLVQDQVALICKERLAKNALVCVWVVDERGVHNHLCVQPGVPGHQTRQLPVMHISPVHPAQAYTIPAYTLAASHLAT